VCVCRVRTGSLLFELSPNASGLSVSEAELIGKLYRGLKALMIAEKKAMAAADARGTTASDGEEGGDEEQQPLT
jgi:hypothetical protein